MPPVPKKPWYPDRVVRDNPDDPSDQSGSRYIRPNSYGDAIMNDAGGDDRGLEKPDPRGDTEPRFFAIPPEDQGEGSLRPDTLRVSYQTKLSPPQERKFRSWVATNNIPFDPSAQSNYDMRGFFKAYQNGDPRARKMFAAWRAQQAQTKE